MTPQRLGLIASDGLLLGHGFTTFAPVGQQRVIELPLDFNLQAQRWRLQGTAWVAVPQPAPPDLSDIDKQSKASRALLKAIATLTHKSEQEAKDAFRRAWNSLP